MSDSGARHVMRSLIGKPLTVASMFELDEIMALRRTFDDAIAAAGPAGRDPRVDPRSGDLVFHATSPLSTGREVVDTTVDDKGRTVVWWCLISDDREVPLSRRCLLDRWRDRFHSPYWTSIPYQGGARACLRSVSWQDGLACRQIAAASARMGRGAEPLCRSCAANKRAGYSIPSNFEVADGRRVQQFVEALVPFVEELVGEPIPAHSQATVGVVEVSSSSAPAEVFLNHQEENSSAEERDDRR